MGPVSRASAGMTVVAGKVPAAFGWALMLLAAGMAMQSSRLLQGQRAQATGSTRSPMKLHYDAAFKFQDAGNLIRANLEYKLYLSMALHRIANGHANLGDYARAAQLYEDSLRLAPEDNDLKNDYAAAALGAADWKKAKAMASSELDSLSRNAQPPDAHAVAELAQALLELGEHQQALQQFKLATELNPSLSSFSQLASAYLVLGDQANAAKILDQMPKKYGDTAALHLKLGSLYGNSKFFDAAIREFTTALAMDSRIHGAHYSLGASYMMQSGEPAYDKAEAEFRKELAFDPANTLVYMPLGRIHLSRHLYAEAEAELKRAAEANPRSAAIYLLLGRLYKEIGKAPQAESALRKSIALTLDPSVNDFEVEQAHFLLGRLLVDRGNAAEGHGELDIARNLLYLKEQQTESRLSGDSSIQMSLERTHESDPSKLATLKGFERESGPIIASSYANLGANSANAGEFANASSYFERAAKWNPDIPGIDESWGRAAFAAREYLKAAAPLSRTLDRHPADAHIRAMLGLTLCLTHDYARSIEIFRPIEEEVESIPELSIAYAGSRAITSGSTQDLDRLKSLELANSAVPLVHYLLGETYSRKKQFRESADELRLALQLDPFSAEAKSALVTADLALGEKTEAMQLLSDLVQAETTGGELHYQLARLQIEVGFTKEAIRNLETATSLNPLAVAYHLELTEAYRKNAQPDEAEREARRSQRLQQEGGSN